VRQKHTRGSIICHGRMHEQTNHESEFIQYPSMPTLNPGRLHQALTSHQLAMALKGAKELDLFKHVGAGANTPAAIAPRPARLG
jgi:hypothetical protein